MTVYEATEKMLEAARAEMPRFEALDFKCDTEVTYHDRKFAEATADKARYITVSLIITATQGEDAEPLEYALGIGAELRRNEISDEELGASIGEFRTECESTENALSSAEDRASELKVLIEHSDAEYAALLKKLKYMQIGSIVTAVIAVGLIVLFSLI